MLFFNFFLFSEKEYSNVKLNELNNTNKIEKVDQLLTKLSSNNQTDKIYNNKFDGNECLDIVNVQITLNNNNNIPQQSVKFDETIIVEASFRDYKALWKWAYSEVCKIAGIKVFLFFNNKYLIVFFYF